MSEEPTIPISGPEGDTDPATQQWREENWTPTDDMRTIGMAETEDPTRTDATQIRGAANLVEKAAGPAKHSGNIDNPGQFMDDTERATQRFVEEHGEHPGFAKAGTTAEEAYKNQTGFSYAGYEVEGMREKAADLDEEANIIGEKAAGRQYDAQKADEALETHAAVVEQDIDPNKSGNSVNDGTSVDTSEEDSEHVSRIVEERNSERAAERDRLRQDGYKLIEDGLSKLREADELDKEITRQAEGLAKELGQRSV